MRPNKLIMENVGPFVGRTVIDFDALDDIFLITGKTGAGKTTIFDALCFVLYGTLPGSRKATVGRLRSDFAAEEDECSVSLEFSLGPGRYRVDRSPKQEKRKKRGSGTTTVDETAVLYEWREGRWESRSDRKTEADDRIRELIGLSAEEFSKIVLLPQGEFAEFLRQNTTERGEVLRKLFPVDLAVRVRELAKARANEAKSRLSEAERALAEAAAKFPAEEAESRLAAAAAAMEAAKGRTAAAAAELGKTAEALRAAEAEEEAARRASEARRAEEELEKRSGEMEELARSLTASRRAAGPAQQLRRAEETRAAAAASESAAASAEQELHKAGRAAAALEERNGEIPALEQEERSLRERRFPLAEAAEEEERSAAEEAELSALTDRRDSLRKELEAAAAEIEKREGELERLQEQAADTESLDRRWEAARADMERLRAMKQAADRIEPLRAEEATLRLRLAELETGCADLERRIPVLESKVRELSAQRAAQESGHAAVLLASALEPGKPCPVCGSTEHPLPAAAAAPVFGLAEQLEALEKSVADAFRDLTAKREESKARSRELERLERELEDGRSLYRTERVRLHAAEDPRLAAGGPPAFGLPPDLPSAAELAAALQACSAEATEANALRTAALRARDRAAVLYRELDGLSKRRAAAEAELSGLSERLGSREAALKGRRAKLGALRAEWRTETVAFALNRLDARIEELERTIASRRAAAEGAGKELAAAGARRTAAQEALRAAETARREAEEALSAALAASPFADEAALRAAILPPVREEELDGELEAWKEARNRLGTVRAEAESALEARRAERAASGERGTAEELRERLSGLEGERREAEEERDRTGAALAALERDRQSYQEAAERRRSLAEEAGRLRAVADDLMGNNPKKRSFDAWLLGLYLQEVAAYAGRRLERMSEGRYSLMLDAEGDGGRGRAGLDLAVFDAYTGKARPCATLSGGESFMASISLALGLADSIQARSGGVRLDAVFIDEGFGSLDEASLDRALTILDEIRDHRMVGLISHVGDMRSRIPSRIDVVKTGSGSAVRI